MIQIPTFVDTIFISSFAVVYFITNLATFRVELQNIFILQLDKKRCNPSFPPRLYIEAPETIPNSQKLWHNVWKVYQSNIYSRQSLYIRVYQHY